MAFQSAHTIGVEQLDIVGQPRLLLCADQPRAMPRWRTREHSREPFCRLVLVQYKGSHATQRCPNELRELLRWQMCVRFRHNHSIRALALFHTQLPVSCQLATSSWPQALHAWHRWQSQLETYPARANPDP